MGENSSVYQVIGTRLDGAVARQLPVHGLEFAQMIAAMWRWHHRELAVRIESPDDDLDPEHLLFELKPSVHDQSRDGFRRKPR